MKLYFFLQIFPNPIIDSKWERGNSHRVVPVKIHRDRTDLPKNHESCLDLRKVTAYLLFINRVDFFLFYFMTFGEDTQLSRSSLDLRFPIQLWSSFNCCQCHGDLRWIGDYMRMSCQHHLCLRCLIKQVALSEKPLSKPDSWSEPVCGICRKKRSFAHRLIILRKVLEPALSFRKKYSRRNRNLFSAKNVSLCPNKRKRED